MSGADPHSYPDPAAEQRGQRREPRWVVAFLRALERTGEARTAAKDAGIDHTTAYARRRTHSELAQAWAEALRRHEDAERRAEEEEIAALKSAPPLPARPLRESPSPAERGGAEVVACAGKVRRVGRGRWSKAKEKIFFEELAATSNMRMAADAAGVSTNAILARRHKSRLFAAKFDAVVHSAKAVIDLYLVEEAKKTFDPDDIDTGDVQPRVTIDQAIRISQLSRRKRQDEEFVDPFEEDAASPSEADADEIRERIINKIRRMRERDMPDMIAQGWSYDESYEQMIPPGWIKGPDYKPRQPEEEPEDDPYAA